MSLTDKAPINKHTFTPWARGLLRSSNQLPLQSSSWKETITGTENHVRFLIQMPHVMKLLLKGERKKKRTIHALQTIGHLHYLLKITGLLCNPTSLSGDTEERG